jgi:hypothetical protein
VVRDPYARWCGRGGTARCPPIPINLYYRWSKEFLEAGKKRLAGDTARAATSEVSRESLRSWMIADGLWRDRRHRLPSPHQPRRRRDCVGELVQIDGSEHAWFEDRGPPCTLLAFVDDATSRLMQLRFVTSESAFDYFRTTRAYVEEHGEPVAFYSDKHGIFRDTLERLSGGKQSKARASIINGVKMSGII